ncbi:uncharacterized protein C3orf38 homolog isoform X2 [Chelmon rostratus]|uniref:uncharacterized protein C3orf38 homolog isoform X2 n=1 Tax=Chelmon rostratus TaxID=109905 RepID=UPI001BE79C64|nr:uncharacterized protein C3orf38 homolog isoform X2 [Chelmon rostratus]
MSVEKMPGLSETERAGCMKILTLMSKCDILSLSDTVTNKLIVVENVTEAVETILSFTKNAEELLKRKKVHRDLIFRYLAKEGVAMPVNTEKHQLIKRTLELWSSGKAAIDKNLHGETDETNRVSDSTSAKAEGGFDPMVLGQQFCQWFFQLLNSQNPSLGQQPQDWGPQHFWPDVKLRLLSRMRPVCVQRERAVFHGFHRAAPPCLYSSQEQMNQSLAQDCAFRVFSSYHQGRVGRGVDGCNQQSHH